MQAVEAKKRAGWESRQRSPVQDDADGLSPCYVPPHVIAVVRQVLKEAIELDPVSTVADNRHARAKTFYAGPDASWPGLKAIWPNSARVWMHVPRGADAGSFVQRALSRARTGAPVVLLTDSTTPMSSR